MKPFIILSLSLFLSSIIYSQNIALKDTIVEQGYYEPDRDAKEAVAKIMMYTGLEPNFTIISSEVSTVIAYIKGTKRYIEYNPEFIKKVRNRANTDWASVSVLAHDIGHHLLGHTLDYGNTSPGDELAADKFSGFILFKMGATIDETVAAMKSVGHELDTLYHPPKSARIEAIKSGWEQAKRLNNKNAYINNNKQDLNLKYKCFFRGDKNVYFVDSNNKIIWFDNYGKPIVIAYKKPSDMPDYEWIYNYGNINYYVDAKGNIWNLTLYGSVFKIGRVEDIGIK